VKYVSTRGEAPSKRFSEILLEGLAADGGLYVPERFPRINLAELRGKSYPDLAHAILAHFMDDVPGLKALVEKTYTKETFGDPEITPLTTLEPGLHLLGLSNGPTLAFKDVALQLIGNLFEKALEQDKKTLNILGATSGDTGSAAEYALRGKKNVNVFMLSPLGRMSAFQSAQMYALRDPNIHNIAVEGVFDDCQDLVKKVNADAAFKEKHRIGAVNSINWARVAAQVVYYFKGYFAATRSDSESVSFAVPSGNFGNIYAGYVAREMGLPVRKLILATNENEVLDEFFRSGTYRPRKAAVATSSPSMDISKASNFERYVYDLLERDGSQVRRRFASGEGFDLSLIPRPGFVSGKSTHADRLATIRSIHGKYGVIIDPHTADGVKVGLAQRDAGVPLICMETALPAKFADTIREALGREPARPPGFEKLEELPQRFEVIKPVVEAVKQCMEKHAG
jgi:threonine synthase